MPDRESVITHLQIIRAWAAFALERDLQFFTPKHLEDIVQWSDDALALLKEQDAVVRCKDCKHQDPERFNDGSGCFVCRKGHGWKSDDWFCAEGKGEQTMPDREKAIKGLEVCLKNIDQQDCPNDCPYFNDCSEYENRVIFQPLMRDSLILLKEQEAKTGKWIEQDGYDGDVYYDCSACGESWVVIDGTPQENGMLYCPHCGANMEAGEEG